MIFIKQVFEIPNPFDEGIPPGYPEVALYDAATKKVVIKTYNNLH